MHWGELTQAMGALTKNRVTQVTVLTLLSYLSGETLLNVVMDLADYSIQ